MEDKSFKKASFREKLGMAKNFAKSVISRGLNDKKVDMTTKQLRVISCFGDDNDLIPCEYLRQSEQDSTKSFAGDVVAEIERQHGLLLTDLNIVN